VDIKLDVTIVASIVVLHQFNLFPVTRSHCSFDNVRFQAVVELLECVCGQVIKIGISKTITAVGGVVAFVYERSVGVRQVFLRHASVPDFRGDRLSAGQLEFGAIVAILRFLRDMRLVYLFYWGYDREI
jgi:hypothetical protein